MKCEKCDKRAISTKPNFCQEHFDEYILQTVQETIDEYKLFAKDTKICVAVSGGKDSLALVHILSRLGYEVEGLYIDEGISNYREITEEDLDAFVQRYNLKLRKVSFKEESGFRLDDAMNTGKVHACTVCGTLRRYLLNKYAKEYDVIATGHNLDDEAQTVLINLARGNTNLLFRSGPKTSENDKFTKRVKPLYFVSEKHVLTYCVLHNIKSEYIECPYAPQAYRAVLRDQLNVVEGLSPHTKKNILLTYMDLKGEYSDPAPTHLPACKRCGEASTDIVCKTCKFIDEVNGFIKESTSTN